MTRLIRRKPPANLPLPSPPTSDDGPMSSEHEEFVGKALDEATREAEAAGWQVRAYSPGGVLTMDFREDRMNLEHQDGVVLRAWVG